MFEGRCLVVATKHKKENVIAPVLERELGVTCFVIPNFDSDTFGTFTGEVERKDDPITTARKKCLLAMELASCDMAVASEGSFGSHPSIFFVPADDEFLLFMDKKNNIEIVVREISVETNFNGTVINNKIELNEFVNRVQFPSHGLIIRKNSTDFSEIEKGITTESRLHEVYEHFSKSYESVYLETDMRAMYNPSRMKVIENATIKLAAKINSICPKCSFPGFGITDSKSGLPCEICHCPTQSTLSFTYVCQKCSFSKEEKYPNKKKYEDPTYCNNCNP